MQIQEPSPYEIGNYSHVEKQVRLEKETEERRIIESANDLENGSFGNVENTLKAFINKVKKGLAKL